MHPQQQELTSLPTVLCGRYKYVKQIGKGGFGVVEQYYDFLTETHVAIKTVLSPFVDQETKRLVREVDVMLHLFNAHPNVMSVLEVFVTPSALPPEIATPSTGGAGGEADGSTPPFRAEDDDVEEPTLEQQARRLAVQRCEARFEKIIADHQLAQQSGRADLIAARQDFADAMQTFIRTAVSADDDFHLHFVMPLMKGDLFYFSKNLSKQGGIAPVTVVAAAGGKKTMDDAYAARVSVVFAFHLCFGLDFLHNCGVVHRDLKPDNVLVWLDLDDAFRSSACIADFGLARDAQSSETFYICTRHYRPPEVITNTSRGETSIDIWSLGCIFFELVTGRTLFNLPTALNSKGQWEGLKASQQLEVILNTCGTPSHGDIRAHMAQNNAQSYLLKSKPRESILVESIRTHWRLHGASPEEQEKWIDLIVACLKFFPQQRPSAADLCRHPLFISYNVHFGKNVLQHPIRPFHPVELPNNPLRRELKSILLDLSMNAATQTVPLPSPPLAPAPAPATDVAEVEEEEPVVALLTKPVVPCVAFPEIEDVALREKFRTMPVHTEAYIDEAVDEVLHHLELHTHNVTLSTQLRSLLSYFVSMKQLSSQMAEVEHPATASHEDDL